MRCILGVACLGHPALLQNPGGNVECDAEWAGLPVAGLQLADVERDILKLQDEAAVDWCASMHGRPCLMKLLVALYSYNFQYASRVDDRMKAAKALHHALRSIEVLLPRMPVEILPCAMTSHLKVSQQLQAIVLSTRPHQVESKPVTHRSQAIANIVLIAIGHEFSKAARATIQSLLHYATCPLQFVVVGNKQGWSSFLAAVRHLPVARQWIDVETHDRYLEIVRLLPAACAEQELPNTEFMKASQVHRQQVFYALAVRMLLHELLPNFDKVISLDVADLLVLTDICRLWGYFDWFNQQQVFAAVWEVGTPQVVLGPHTGDDVSLFWSNRGLPWTAKGLNTGVILFDLDRLRMADINGSNWTSVMLKISHTMRSQARGHWCALSSQATLSTFVFRLGESYMYELSSKWNYIPDVPWELAEQDARASGMPKTVVDHKLHPGMLPGGRLVHPCPSYTELVGEWALTSEDKSTEATWWIARAKEYIQWFTEYGAPGFYTSDLRCGEEIFIAHMAGHVKTKPWAQKLLHFWSA